MDLVSQNQREHLLLDIALLLTAAILVTLPIFLWGIPQGNDLAQHFQFAGQFDAAVRHGIFAPDWGWGSNGGAGDVGIRFYPPAAYYPLVAFKALTGSWFFGTALVFAFWFFLGSPGSYLLGREWLDRRASLAAGLIFIALPYHVNQIFNAFLYAEFAAAAILPFCFLFLTRVVRRAQIVDIAGFAAATAILVLTHLPTSIMAAIALAIYFLVLCEPRRILRASLQLSVGGLVGLISSSYYWIKPLMELSYVKHSTAEFTSSTFDFHSNFLASFFYTSSEEYAARSLFFADSMLFLTLALAAAAVILMLVAKQMHGRSQKALIALVLTGVFFATPLSLPVWEAIRPLQRIQFPFRWMTIITLGAAMLAGGAVGSLREAIQSKWRPIAIALGGTCLFCLAFTIAQVIRPAIYIPKVDFETRVAALNTSDSCDCWLPVWAKRDASAQKPTADAAAIPVVVNGTTEHAPLTIRDGQATADLFYYPYWRLETDGDSSEVGSDASGRITFAASSVTPNASLRFAEPRYISLSKIASFAGWIAIIAAFGAALLRRQPHLLATH